MSELTTTAKPAATQAVTDAPQPFRLGHIFRLSTFQIGSASADILTASVWNRVMISDLGMPATFVGLLLALQYFLLPISFWAGHRSDRTNLWGRRRTSYIWFGRALMVLSFPLLGLSVTYFDAGDTATGWLLALVAFLMFGVGKLFSGSIYLALVRESAPVAKKGIALGIAEATLIAFFPIMAVAYGRWMEVYDPETFASILLFTAVLCAFFWWFSIFRSERDLVPVTLEGGTADSQTAETFRTIWHDRRVRRFFAFLFLATFAAWMQDNVLEPFGADVFGFEAGETTRFTGYWGGMTLVVLIGCFVFWRKRPPESLSGVAKVGLSIMAVGMALLGLTSFGLREELLLLALLVFGLGFGFYTFGGLSLMAVMSPDRNAGAFLGLWTVCILVSKGLGTFAGGLFRDLFHFGAGWSFADTYGAVFVLAALGLLLAAAVLRGRQVIEFAREEALESTPDTA